MLANIAGFLKVADSMMDQSTRGRHR